MNEQQKKIRYDVITVDSWLGKKTNQESKKTFSPVLTKSSQATPSECNHHQRILSIIKGLIRYFCKVCRNTYLILIRTDREASFPCKHPIS